MVNIVSPITVPDHDTLIKHIQNLVIEAVDKLGWPYAADIAENYDISITLIRRVYLWEPKDNRSFNFRKLIEVYDFAYDVVHGYRAKKQGA